MVDLKYGKSKSGDAGFFLLESLLTLSILMLIILSVSPLIMDWLSLHQDAKESLEDSRLIYEKSMELKNSTRTSLNQSDQIMISNHVIEIRGKERRVSIDEIKFNQE